MRREGSVLFLLALSACQHEAREPLLAAPAGRGEVSRPYLARDDAAIETRYQGAPAILRLEGEASYYSDRLAGHKTASGEPYRPHALTAAHRNLPFGTILRVTRRDQKRSVYVRINDRGPYGSEHRILDLSRAAFEQLGSARRGVLEVSAEVVVYGRKGRH